MRLPIPALLNSGLIAIHLFLVLISSQTSFGQEVSDQKLLSAVKAAEASWNATAPDKSFMSDGNKIQYGLDYLKAGNYSSASWSFEEILNKNADNAYANFFMGCVQLGLKDQAAASRYFDKAARLNAVLKDKAAALAMGKKSDANYSNNKNQEGRTNNSKENTNQQNSPAIALAKTQGGINHYKVGDKVEVVHAGGWWPGEVTRVEGEDKSVYVTVDYTFQNSKYNASFFYNCVRPATGHTTVYVAASKAGGPLVYGDYTLSRGLGLAATPSGHFTLYANGRYTYLDVTGTYSYNPANGIITWKSGTFYDWGKNTSTFTKGKRVSQIDMTYPQTSGPLYYAAGHNN